MRTYIVGGAVRDFLLGRPVKDFDYVVTGATPDEMLAQGFTQVGADFPVFLHPETKDEYALARTERKTAAGYHGFEVRFDPSVTIEEDLSRRDLTINAMAVAVEDWERFKYTLDAQLVVDPFNGWSDLLAHRLHAVGEWVDAHSEQENQTFVSAFSEDPVRILRTARFQARYGFAQTRETTREIMEMVNSGEADALVPERVWAETWKAIDEKSDPLDFFFFLEFHDVRAKLFKRLKLTDALMFDFDNTEYLSRAKRMALLTVRFKNDNQVALFFDELKAPKDVRDLAVATHKLAKLANTDDELDPEVIVDTLQDVGAFGNSARNAAEGLQVAARMHTDFVAKSHAFNVQRLQALLPKLAHVSFASLTDEQQATLKGAEIGKALRDLRVDMVRNG
jgi:tRNA nucleotidyltransferase (CCA-adding enzyme)